MSASIRGHQSSIKLFKNGQNTDIVHVTSCDVNQDSSFSRDFYIGQSLPQGNQVCEGWSGTIECDVRDSKVDDLIDAIVTGNLAGVGADEITLLLGENYPDGTSRSYVYFDLQVKMSKRQPNMTDKVTKRLEFQASGRLPL